MAPDSDVGPFRLSGAPVLSYTIFPAGEGTEKEFRLSSKRSMASIITKLEDLMSRACIGMMSNSTLLDQIKVGCLHLPDHAYRGFLSLAMTPVGPAGFRGPCPLT